MTDKEYLAYLENFKNTLPENHGYAFIIFSNHDNERQRFHIGTNLEPGSCIKLLEKYIEHMRKKMVN